ncbi:putative iron-siderophore uptake system transmembrane component [Corynebacterium diphtheriae BH8]|nr:putative iron-siderophore uptake system transmembrane component [Corynebacterium diphtheriae BH8]
MLRQPRVRLPLPLVITFLVIILLCMIIMSLGVGARNITSPDILAALRHYGDPTNSHIIWGRRIPRTLIAIAAGASLSLAGVLIQALTRNPLADTGVFGINAGAAFTIVIGIALAGSLSHISIFALALLGAILAGACVYALSMNSCKGSDPLRLVLAGVALSAILTGIGDGLSLVNPQAFDRLKSWMVGNIDAGSYQPAAVAGVGLILGILVTATCMRQLNALSLGDELAITMGASIAKTRLFTFIAIVVLAASATAAAGVITFLGPYGSTYRTMDRRPQPPTLSGHRISHRPHHRAISRYPRPNHRSRRIPRRRGRRIHRRTIPHRLRADETQGDLACVHSSYSPPSS